MNRDPGSKWFVSRDDFAPDRYPNYPSGMGCVHHSVEFAKGTGSQVDVILNKEVIAGRDL